MVELKYCDKKGIVDDPCECEVVVFNLSNWIEYELQTIHVDKIKEFIRLLKKEILDYKTDEYRLKFIDKLAGDKLI